jgi:hypothetical protein
MPDRYPSYDGTRLREVLDNGRPGDRYLAIFEDGTALCVRHDGRRSAWQDDLYDMDPWTLGQRVPFRDLPAEIKRALLARADELAAILSGHP